VREEEGGGGWDLRTKACGTRSGRIGTHRQQDTLLQIQKQPRLATVWRIELQRLSPYMLAVADVGALKMQDQSVSQLTDSQVSDQLRSDAALIDPTMTVTKPQDAGPAYTAGIPCFDLKTQSVTRMVRRMNHLEQAQQGGAKLLSAVVNDVAVSIPPGGGHALVDSGPRRLHSPSRRNHHSCGQFRRRGLPLGGGCGRFGNFWLQRGIRGRPGNSCGQRCGGGRWGLWLLLVREGRACPLVPESVSEGAGCRGACTSGLCLMMVTGRCAAM